MRSIQNAMQRGFTGYSAILKGQSTPKLKFAVNLLTLRPSKMQVLLVE